MKTKSEGRDWWDGHSPEPLVYEGEPRLSSLVGPDGKPLTYPKRRFKLGFDLTTKVHTDDSAELTQLRCALAACITSLERSSTEEGVCCCGDDMSTHADAYTSGHQPTDMGEYYAGHAIKAGKAALGWPE